MIDELGVYITDSLGGGDFQRGLDRARARFGRFAAAKTVR